MYLFTLFIYFQISFFDSIMKTVVIIYKSYIRNNLCYVDIISDKPFNEAYQKIERVQYHSAHVCLSGELNFRVFNSSNNSM